MCGIFGYVGARHDAAALILSGLTKLEYRGYDSWGVAVKLGAGAVVDKRVGKIGNATTALPPSSAGIGHTRWATHGGVTQDNAHPHLDCSGRLAVVHNGIVANDAELRAELVTKGHRFRSETDSELVAHLVEDELGRAPLSGDRVVWATMAAFRRLRGLNAVAIFDAATGTIAAAKNGSPLCIGFAASEHFLASDHVAFLIHTRRVAFVRDGEALLLTGGSVRVFEIESGRETKPDVTTVEWADASADRGVHPDYMTKEIHEQPDALARLADAGRTAATELAREIERSTEAYAVGCGSGWHAALAAQYLFGAVGHRVTAVAGSEFTYQERFVKPGSLVIAFSQSGETVDILEAARSARARGARVAAVTNVQGSTLWRLADLVLPLDVGPERCVVSTKALTAKIAFASMTAGAIAGVLDDAARGVGRAALDIRALLQDERRRRIADIARSLRDRSHLYVIGRGLSYAIAMETALKIKEVSYLHAEGFAGGELKHGVIALIEPGTPCIVLAPSDDTLSDVMAATMQVKARGASVIGIAARAHEAFDDYLEVPELGPATAIVNAVPAQLIGYELARLRGHDPDMPRNLAKSVTVK